MPANSIIASPPMTTPMIAPVLRTGDFPLEAVGVWELELELEPVPEFIPDEDAEPVGSEELPLLVVVRLDSTGLVVVGIDWEAEEVELGEELAATDAVFVEAVPPT